MLMPVTQQFGPGIIGAGNPIALDYLPMSWITVTAFPVSTMSGLVQVTLDNVFDQNDPNYVTVVLANWLAVAGPAVAPAPYTPMPAQTTPFYLTFPGPWRAIRWFSTANATGVIFVVAQSTAPRA